MENALKCVATLAALASAAVAQPIVYVNAGANGRETGESWADAYTDLQDGLARAQAGDEIWVAKGSYFPGAPGEWESTFQLKSGVGIYGGFVGGEQRREERNPAAHVTILSGDIDHNDTYGQGTWDGPGWNGNADNVFHVVTTDGVDENTVLDGFTILGGATNYGQHVSPWGDYGSGVFNNGGRPTFINCTIKRNIASFGAGVYSTGGAMTFIRCTIMENRVHLYEGAGIMVVEGCQLTLTDCTLTQNRLRGGNMQGAGAGVSIRMGCTADIAGCSFIDNTADNFYPSGDYQGTYGGAINHFGDSLSVRDCVFKYNRSNAGGAIWCWRSAAIVNCLFFDNRAPEYHGQQGGWGGVGGAIAGGSYNPMTIEIVNCTIVKNSAEAGAGIRILNSADAAVSNCILWGNVDRNGSIGPSQIKGAGASYSCIQNMLVGEPGEDPPDPRDFPHCNSRDPRFVNLVGGDLHVDVGSPAIDAADNQAVPNGVEADLDGRPRFVDDPASPDTGRGTPPIVDMGAYEFQTGGQNCTGQETLKASCKGGQRTTLKATLKNGSPRATVTFRVDGDPNTDVVKTVKNTGKAVAKFTNVPSGPHGVEIVECGIGRNTTCP